MVGDGHQALYSLSETKNSNNPFLSSHFPRAVSHDMPSSAAVFQVATVTKPNLTAKICFTAKLVDIPLARTQRATSRGSSVPACTADGTQDPPNHVHIFLGNLEPRNIPPNRSCCNTAHRIGSNDLDSPPKRRFSTRTHTHIFRFPRIHKWKHTQRKQQRRPQPTACETTVRNVVGLTTRCHQTNHDRSEQLTPSCHHDQKVERHCPS